MKRREFLGKFGSSLAGMAAGGAVVSACGGTQTTGANEGAASVQTQKKIRWRLASSFPRSLDTIFGAAEYMAERVKALGWTGTDNGLVEGDFACLANATQTSRGSHGVRIDTTPLSRLIYKGSQISIRTGSMPKWILQRFSCSFARYSAEALDELQLDWAPAYFCKETICIRRKLNFKAAGTVSSIRDEPFPGRCALPHKSHLGRSVPLQQDVGIPSNRDVSTS